MIKLRLIKKNVFFILCDVIAQTTCTILAQQMIIGEIRLHLINSMIKKMRFFI